jgi:uncharacterized SAM-binding protein YcdF (DUF218 family)
MIRKPIAILCLLGAAFFMAPLASGQVLHPGMWLPAAALVLVAVLALIPSFLIFLFTGPLRIAIRILAGFAGLGLLCMLALFIWMGFAANNEPPEDANVTVIVLGCRVVGDEPTGMLAARINAAYEYLSQNPGALCIAAGGLGSDATLTEAQVIYNGLVRLGISGSRIFLEERSHSTYENLLYSAEVIAANGLPGDVVIVSDSFHQLRASLFAKEIDLVPYAVNSSDSWMAAPGYWVREAMAVGKALVTGR